MGFNSQQQPKSANKTGLLIKRIEIENYRGIRHCILHPQRHNLLVGPNNSGKSSILEAIALVLGSDRSTTAQIVEYDFFQGKYTATSGSPASAIFVELTIGLPIGAKLDFNLFPASLASTIEQWDDNKLTAIPIPENQGHVQNPVFRVSFKGWYDAEEDTFRGVTYLPKNCPRDISPDEVDHEYKVGKEFRDKIGFLILGDWRSAKQQLTFRPYSLLTRAIIASGIKLDDYEALLNILRPVGSQISDQFELANFSNQLRQSLEKASPALPDLQDLFQYHVTDLTRQVLRDAVTLFLKDNANNIPLPIERHGAGMRGLVLMALLDILASKKSSCILAVEEPEAFLHPHAYRGLVRQGMEIATQTFFTTHSPLVVESFLKETIGHVRHKADGTVKVSFVTPFKDSENTTAKEIAKTYRTVSREFRQTYAEGFVSRIPLLVEGYTEPIALRVFSERIPTASMRLDALGVSIINCKDNGNLKNVANSFATLGIPVCALLDNTKAEEIKTLLQPLVHTLFIWKEKGIEAAALRNIPAKVLLTFLKKLGKTPPNTNKDIFDAALETLMDNKGKENAWEVYFDTIQEAGHSLDAFEQLINSLKLIDALEDGGGKEVSL